MSAAQPAVPRGIHQRIDIELAERSYPIFIGRGLLQERSLLDAVLPEGGLLVVTNQTVAALYLENLRTVLGTRHLGSIVLQDGEQYKTLHSFSLIIDAVVEARVAQHGTLLALGGGVVGDITGFAAACYQRGVGYVQMPTTLLAQIDSSVGGKTAVNHAQAKNMIGAFHQPKAVIADIATLATLPEREFRAGLAEILKYGLIEDVEFFAWLESHAQALLERQDSALMHAIRRSCEIKARIVEQDEYDQGMRATLNLGHTFGHAIEAAGGYGNWLHGEAVAAGTVIAADFSARLGWLSAGDVARIVALLRRFDLPIRPPRIGAAQALRSMALDKKVLDGRLRFVLLRRFGEAALVDEYPQQVLAQTLHEYFD